MPALHAEHLRAILQHVSEPPEALVAACSQHVQSLLSRAQAAPLLNPNAQVRSAAWNPNWINLESLRNPELLLWAQTPTIDIALFALMCRLIGGLDSDLPAGSGAADLRVSASPDLGEAAAALIRMWLFLGSSA